VPSLDCSLCMLKKAEGVKSWPLVASYLQMSSPAHVFPLFDLADDVAVSPIHCRATWQPALLRQ
jgi:hypothetical protein